jgi:uncharacterized protein (TIGR03435 family)
VPALIRLAICSLFVTCVYLQALPAFEVASIKPADPSARTIDFREEPGRLTIANMALLRIVQNAYDMKWYWITGGPAWIDKDRFDIVAKANGNPSHEQMMKMLQTLLEDRFKLKLHSETKEGAVFHLVVAKNGPRLSASKDKNGDSYVGAQLGPVTHRFIGRNATIEMLARRLEDELRRPVIDLPGIAGQFDFNFEFAVDDSKPENVPSIFSAIQELGLKLESAKGPVETLVINHVEKPSEN